jgi:hypothetical protein
MNLTTTFIGLLFATFIAEKLIKNYESKIQSRLDRRVVFQINRFINNFLLSLHIKLKFDGNPFNWQDYSSDEFINVDEFMNLQLLKTTKTLVYPNLEDKLVNINAETYEELISFFTDSISELEKINKKFNHYYSYELAPYLIDIDNSLNSIVNTDLYFVRQRYLKVEDFLNVKTAEPKMHLQNLSSDIKSVLLKIFDISKYFKNKYGVIPHINIGDKFYNEK